MYTPHLKKLEIKPKLYQWRLLSTCLDQNWDFFVIAGQTVDQVQVPPVLRGEGPVAGNFEKFDKFAWK